MEVLAEIASQQSVPGDVFMMVLAPFIPYFEGIFRL
jgi:hypothetical protein